MTFTVGTKGQVTIAKELRETLGIMPGWRTMQRLDGDRVVLEFTPPKHLRSLAGILSDASTIRIATSEELERLTELAWESAAEESVQEATE